MKDYICPCGLTEKRNRPPKKSGNHGKIALSGFQLHMLVVHLRYTKKEAIGLKTNLSFRQPRDQFHLKVNNHILSQMESTKSHIAANVRLVSEPYEPNPYVKAIWSKLKTIQVEKPVKNTSKTGDLNQEKDESNKDTDLNSESIDNSDIPSPPGTPSFIHGSHYGIPKLHKNESEEEVRKRLEQAGMRLTEFYK